MCAHKSESSRVSLRQKVYAEIKQDIISCRLEPGAPLSEHQFLERFQVSKTPIREALTSLQQDHLVEYIPNRGFMVAPISIIDVKEIFEARQFYETALYKLAIQRINPDEIVELERLSCLEPDSDRAEAMEAVLQNNLQFHLGIARIAGNGRMYWHYASLMDEAQRLIYLDYKSSNNLSVWRHSHTGILDALRSQDEQTGIQSIIETLDLAQRRILRIG